MKTILVTGSAGFIGSNFVCHLAQTRPDLRMISLDKMTYAARKENLSEVLPLDRHELVVGDICDESLVQKLFEEHKFQEVLHFAAESHVDNSIAGPKAFVQTNVNGSFNLLENARRLWMAGPGQLKPEFESARFYMISTDEVFGSLGATGSFTEESPYKPNNPYSATKAAADLLARSYFKTFGLPVVLSNCSNNYGPKQHAEKLIPTVIRKALAEQPIPVYGKGENIRDWLFVKDHCRAIQLILEKGRIGETYAVGGECEKRNIDLVQTICRHLDQVRPRKSGKYEDLIQFVTDRPGHDQRYAISPEKIRTELGFVPETSFEDGMKQTLDWYLSL